MVMKRLLLLFGLAFVFALSGCEEEEDDPTPSSSSTSSSSSSSTSGSNTSSDDGPDAELIPYYGPNRCNDAGFVPVREGTCCPADAPYLCGDRCYESFEGAALLCDVVRTYGGSSGGSSGSTSATSSTSGGSTSSTSSTSGGSTSGSTSSSSSSSTSSSSTSSSSTSGSTSSTSSTTQQVVFWTSSSRYGQIRVYVNNRFRGTITSYYTSGSPDCGDRGAVTVTITSSNNTWRAESTSGSYEWSDTFTASGSCTSMQLR